MTQNAADLFRPVAPPQIIECLHGGPASPLARRRAQARPGRLILAEHFKSPEELVATTTGRLPEGVKLTWDRP